MQDTYARRILITTVASILGLCLLFACGGRLSRPGHLSRERRVGDGALVAGQDAAQRRLRFGGADQQ